MHMQKTSLWEVGELLLLFGGHIHTHKDSALDPELV